ncbi:lysylphosphatidylglycerol synthase domain-containing protein [Nevskia ramosa]|uniref:lysylphosphatidylglycerol synthase domain-containing protein n=1 Tax=Nevskia ramosa TaxID=64002 RepID=UPI0003B4BBAA|nr:lysylphosphatidylglycerol synthase domain-containing protein [Nevskia ramosa]
MTKWLTALFGLLGLGLLIGLVAQGGTTEILALLATAGWGLLWLIPFHVLPIALDAEGWRVLLRHRDVNGTAHLPFLWWIASVREAVGRLLPVGGVGGEIVGIRLTLWRVPDGAAVTASVVIETLLTIVNVYLFVAAGLCLVIALDGGSLAGSLLGGLAATLPVPLLLYWLLRHGALFARIEKLVIGMLGEESKLAALFGSASRLDAELRLIFERRRDLLISLLWQLAGMVVGAFEVWLALRLLGHEISPLPAIALEALGLSIRHFAFFVPAGLGVQEAGFVLFGQLLGVPADAAIALSLAKRVRELGYGIPALLSWQWAETRRALKRQGSDQR